MNNTLMYFHPVNGSYERDCTFGVSPSGKKSGYASSIHPVDHPENYEVKTPLPSTDHLAQFIQKHEGWHRTSFTQRVNAENELRPLRADFTDSNGNWFIRLDYEEGRVSYRPLRLGLMSEMTEHFFPLSGEGLDRMAKLFEERDHEETSADRLERFRHLTEVAQNKEPLEVKPIAEVGEATKPIKPAKKPATAKAGKTAKPAAKSAANTKARRRA